MRSHRTWPLWLLLLVAASSWGVDHPVTVGGQTAGGYYGGNPILMFNPSQLSINVGDTVTFTNAGGFHNVDADDGSFRCAQGCDGNGGNGNPDGSAWQATVTFNQPGTFGYHCEIHGSMGMTGTITVQGTTPTTVNLDQHGLTGSWANPLTNGQGIVMEVYPDLGGPGLGVLFGGWFTYDTTPNGGQRWYTIQGQVGSTDASATMPIYLTDGGELNSSQPTTTTPVGTATIAFSDCMHGALNYSFSDGSGRVGMIPLDRLLVNTTCGQTGDNGDAASDYLLSGAWADPHNSGQGLVFDVNPPQSVLFAAWYTFAHDATQSSGPGGQRWYTLQAAVIPGTTTLNGIGIYDTTGGLFDRPAGTSTLPVGSADLVFHDCGTATLSYSFTSGENAGRSGTLDLARVGPTPAGCTL